ncbi:MAG: hypothetical protein ACOY5B_03885 [Spirochaetota bacterium]
MKKTSIYLPGELIPAWNRKHRAMLARLPELLQKARQFRPTRKRLRRYQNCPGGGVIVSVYWPLSVYNRLHGFATATRISVSLLITYLLLQTETQNDTRPGFLSYAFAVIDWSDERLAYREELRFFTIPPPLTP